MFADKMPRANMLAEEKAKLCSLFFRPWSLCADFAAVPHVPHLLQLPLYPVPIVRRRKRGKGKPETKETEPSWTSSWARFIRGNIPSEHAARIIRRFLSLMVPRAGDNNNRHSDEEAESEMGDMEGHAAKPVQIDLGDAHKILRDDDKRQKAGDGVRAHYVTGSGKPEDEIAWDTTGNDPTAQSEEYKKAATFMKKSYNNKALRNRFLVASDAPLTRGRDCAHALHSLSVADSHYTSIEPKHSGKRKGPAPAGTTGHQTCTRATAANRATGHQGTTGHQSQGTSGHQKDTKPQRGRCSSGHQAQCLGNGAKKNKTCQSKNKSCASGEQARRFQSTRGGQHLLPPGRHQQHSQVARRSAGNLCCERNRSHRRRHKAQKHSSRHE